LGGGAVEALDDLGGIGAFHGRSSCLLCCIQPITDGFSRARGAAEMGAMLSISGGAHLVGTAARTHPRSLVGDVSPRSGWPPAGADRRRFHGSRLHPIVLRPGSAGLTRGPPPVRRG